MIGRRALRRGVVVVLAVLVGSVADLIADRAVATGRDSSAIIQLSRALRGNARWPRARVSLELGRAGIAVPRSFLGFSTEYWTLPLDARHVVLYGRLLSQLHVPGDPPLVLRIGGDSSDRSLVDPAVADRGWAYGLTRAWISQTSRFVRANHLRVIVDLNLITGSPNLAASWAWTIEQALPRGSIIGFEVGNEPDLYQRSAWLRELVRQGLEWWQIPSAMPPYRYAASFLDYATTLARVAPGVPLLGPALAEPSLDRGFVATLLAGPHPGLGAISIHEYPYTRCARHSAHDYPTIGRLLSDRAVTAMAVAAGPVVRLARAASLPVRVTEFNSITCGGAAGVSNSFANALWAPDALFSLVSAGVSAADMHVRAYTENAPFWFGSGGVVRPLFYGLVAFTRMLGRDARLVGVQVHMPRRVRLRVWATTVARGVVHVLLLNKGHHPVDVLLLAPPRATGEPAVQRLLAPSARSRAGVTLDGQRLDHAARWVGERLVETVLRRRGVYEVALPAISAAIVSFRVAPKPITSAAGR